MTWRLFLALMLLATGGSAVARVGINGITEQVRDRRPDRATVRREDMRRAELARERSEAAARKRAAEAERESSQTPQTSKTPPRR